MNLNNIYVKGLDKVNSMESELTDFPHTTSGGSWLTSSNAHWTGGFWVGLLWLQTIYHNEKSNYRNKTINWAKRLKVRMNDNKTHDMGFIFGPSCLYGYHLVGDDELKKMTIAGAYNMKDLYKEKAGLILAWDEPGYEGAAIVDTIMNLPLMIWVANQQKDHELHEIACNVADNIIKYHIRGDYSIYHLVRWDTNSFEIVEQSTHQGYSASTCWSRGQAWALYGFSNMYRYTSNPTYLKVSEKLAEYFWGELDDEVCLPRWDFHFKNKSDQPIDSSAASIAASGMLLLSDMLTQTGNVEKSNIWSERGEKIIKALSTHCLYTDMNKYGILEKATVDKPHNSGIGESTMYGDYYFMEAIYRLINKDNRKLIEQLY